MKNPTTTKQPQPPANDIPQMPNAQVPNVQNNVPKNPQNPEVELMRMATDLTLNILNKSPMYRGMDDSERTLAFAVKAFDNCVNAVARNYKNHFASLR